MIDLHMHTKNSDGSDTTEELIKKAEDMKLKYISITDHDNLHAHEEIREEAGTPGILEFIRASLAYQLREEIGQEWIANSKKELIKILKEFLENESKITIYGNPNYNSNGTFSFNIQNKSPYEIANKLSKDFGILVRAGCSCAGPYGHDLLGLKDNTIFEQKPGWIRVSLHYTHQKKEIHYLCNSLKILCK